MAFDPDAIVGTPSTTAPTPPPKVDFDPDAHVAAAQAAATRTAKLSPGFWDNVGSDAKFMGQQALWAGRQALQGAESLPGMALDSGTGVTNLAKMGLNKLGLDDDPTYAQMPSQANDQALNQLLPGTQSTTAAQKVAGAGIQMMAGSRVPQGSDQAIFDLLGIGDTGSPLAAAPKNMVAGQTAGQVTGSQPLQELEATLGRSPGGQPIRNAITQQKNDAVAGIQSTVDSLSGGQGTTPYAIGTNLDKALADGAQDLKNAGQAAYAPVDKAVANAPGGTIPINLSKTMAYLNVIGKLDPNAPETSALLKSPQVQAIFKALKSDLAPTPAVQSSILGPGGQPMVSQAAQVKYGLPYQTVKGLISDLGDSIDWTGLNGGQANSKLKQLYGLMRQDVNGSVSAASPDLAVAVNKANTLWQDSASRLDDINKALSGNGGLEQIFNKLANGTKLGPSGLMAVMDHVPESSQRLVAAGILQRMGKGPAGEFSADTFLTNWGKMDPDAKNRLFGSLPQDYQKNVDQIVKNVKSIKAYQNVLPNSSNTAHAGAWGTSVGGAMMAALTGHPAVAGAFGAAAGSTFALSKALTNPKIVSYLARETRPSKVLGLSGALPPLATGLTGAMDAPGAPGSGVGLPGSQNGQP